MVSKYPMTARCHPISERVFVEFPQLSVSVCCAVLGFCPLVGLQSPQLKHVALSGLEGWNSKFAVFFSQELAKRQVLLSSSSRDLV